MMIDKDFLKNFDQRMKCVGRYSVLCSNSFDKKLWKEYGIETRDEQMNMLFTLLLFIMEYSLREENCTMDEIASFVEDISYGYYGRKLNFEKSQEFARFMVEDILGNSGSSMYFKAFDYEKRTYQDINIRYIDNKVVYLENGVRRTSYYLTDEGYNMILATMEMENNLKLSVHEMLFKLHMEKADYNRAVDDIKNIFGQLRKQSQKIEEAILAVRRNALSYSVEEYGKLVEDNISTVVETREKFRLHRDFIEEKIEEFEEKQMNAEEFTEKEKTNLGNLRTIGRYLTQTLDEHQRILGQHFDLKKLYDEELENYSNMTLVQRFPFRSDVYDKILKDASLLKNADKIFAPLFSSRINKIFNPEKMMEYQKKLKKSDVEDESMELDFDEEKYNREKEQSRQERMKKYEGCVNVILEQLVIHKEMTLETLNIGCKEEERERLLPTAEIFREVIIEFLTAGTIDIGTIQKEQTDYLMDASEGFVLNEMLLAILEDRRYRKIGKIHIFPMEDGKHVHFKNVMDEAGNRRNFKCSNVGFCYEER